MANYEATRYDFDGANLQDVQGLNTGLIIPWTDSSVPTGFLECDGSAVSRSTYSALFAIIGTTYGAGNGSTTFNLPNLQDNITVSKSGTKALASTGGAATVAPTGNIGGNAGNHTVTTPEMASHSHPATARGGVPEIGPPTGSGGGSGYRAVHPSVSGNMNFGNTGGGGAHGHTFSGNFTGDANSVLQPYITLLYIIKT
jgi:microcystin-dependent protein|tara:strand:- start:303 stop:899 length:597 start_codon:yes stop_codon:yes gene_type:complete